VANNIPSKDYDYTFTITRWVGQRETITVKKHQDTLCVRIRNYR